MNEQGLLFRQLSSKPKDGPPQKNKPLMVSDSEVHDYTEQEMESKDVLRVLWKYLWPDDHPEVKRRVLLSMGLLGAGKLFNVQVSNEHFTICRLLE